MTRDQPGVELRLYSGRSADLVSPTRNRVPVILADVTLQPGAHLAQEIPAAHTGFLYVLEGSRLGGQVLLRQVLASPDPVVRGNARFLRHGEGLRLWPSLVAWLAARRPSEHGAAIEGALAAFGAFEAAQAGP